MGLNFNNADASWSYSGFNIFRNRVWDKLCINILLDEWYESDCDEEIMDITDPLYWFFNHSDCDGDWSVKQMKSILPKLEEIINSFETDDIHESYDKQEGLKLIEGIKNCIKENKIMRFQ